ncbi:glycoprotein [Chagres virus]|uniref:Envelopment polyprotein n=1 Tax=Chagres virus TaxID=629727 RepID=I1T324_9VIRU|nr:glycoprotein [Chagres virus]AEL29641.1 glycoprotein [Chagres virus]
MYIEIVSVMLLASTVYCAYILTASRPKGTTKICLSNLTPYNSLTSYWNNLNSDLENGDRQCSVGTSGMSYTTNSTIMSLIREVQISQAHITLTCKPLEAEDEKISMRFDGLADDFHYPSVLNCENSSLSLGPIPNIVPDMGDLIREDANDKIGFLRDRLASMEERLVSETKLLEAEREIRNQELNDHSERYHFNDVRLKAHEDDIKDKDDKISEQKHIIAMLSKNITILHDKLNKMSINPRAEMKVIPTVVSVALLSSSLTSAALSPHIRNRIGDGKYKLEDTDEESCRPVTYGSICPGFDLLTRSPHYPFFKSHYFHRSMLEALNDNIITKSDSAICTINSSKGVNCHEEKQYLKMMCPNQFRSAHYLDLKGKIRAVKCEEGYELTEDCFHCRKIKPDTGKPLWKSSIALQDVVCQQGASTYSGPIVSPKEYCSIGGKKYKKCDSHSTKIETVPFVTFQSVGKMYLESLQVRNTETMSKESFICYDHMGQVNGQSTGQADSRLLKKFDISKCKNVDDTKSDICSGDELFCSAFQCSGENPVAQCIIAPGSGPLEVNINGVWLKPICVGFEKTIVKKENKRQVINQQSSCSNCLTSCLQEGILVRSTGFKMISAVACSHGSCSSVAQQPSTEIMIPYPGMMASAGGTVGIHVSHDDNSVSAKLSASCPPQDQCKAHSCSFCVEAIINYQCHSLISGFMVFCFVFSLLLMVVILIINILKALRVSPKVLKKPLLWVLALLRWMASRILLFFHVRLVDLNQQIGWNGEVVVEQARPGRITRYMYTVGLLMSLITLVTPCSEVAVASSKMTRCSTKGSKTTCKVSGSVLLRAGVIGSEACLLIKGHSDTQKTLLSIRTESSEIVCREGQSFWTGQFVSKCMSSRRCHGVGECIDQMCQEWKQNVTSSEFSSISKNERMSENVCIEQCGGLGCSCFNINPSCLFVHAELMSTRKEAVRVFNCIDWVHKLNFVVTDAQGQSEKVSLGSMSSKMFKWGTMTLSLDAEAITGSNSLLFMQNHNGGFALSDEQFSDIAREGYIGEIRCSSESAVISAHSSCKRAPNLIKYRPILDIAECSTNLIDPFSMFLRGSLPQTRNGKTFTATKDSKSVQALANAQINAQISLNIDDYDIEFKEDAPSCEAVFLNVSGCYSCNLGAQVCIKVSISEQGVFHAHSADNVVQIGFHVLASRKEYCQIVHFDSPHIDISLMYSCGLDERPIELKGSLIAIMPYDLRNNTVGASTVVNPRQGSWSFSNWAGGLISWIGGPLKSIFLIMVYIVASILGILVFLYISKRLISSAIMKLIARKTK